MEPKGSSPHSQEPTTFPYPEPDRSSLCLCPSNLSKIHFNIILPAVPGFSKLVYFPQVLPLKPCMHFFSPLYVLIRLLYKDDNMI